MIVKIQYADFTEWEGHPSTFADSPDKGIVQMWAEDDFGNQGLLVYDDFYYVYPSGSDWIVGSGTAQREFKLIAENNGTLGLEKFKLPDTAIVRLGQQVSQEDAVTFGLIDEGGKLLSPKATVNVQVG